MQPMVLSQVLHWVGFVVLLSDLNQRPCVMSLHQINPLPEYFFSFWHTSSTMLLNSTEHWVCDWRIAFGLWLQKMSDWPRRSRSVGSVVASIDIKWWDMLLVLKGDCLTWLRPSNAAISPQSWVLISLALRVRHSNTEPGCGKDTVHAQKKTARG